MKLSEEISFKSLAESLESPIAPGKEALELCDHAKIGRPFELHRILTGVLEYFKTNSD